VYCLGVTLKHAGASAPAGFHRSRRGVGRQSGRRQTMKRLPSVPRADGLLHRGRTSGIGGPTDAISALPPTQHFDPIETCIGSHCALQLGHSFCLKHAQPPTAGRAIYICRSFRRTNASMCCFFF
jgi:hypothetical protein